MSPDSQGHVSLFHHYARALLAMGDTRGANRVAKEALARDLPFVEMFMSEQRRQVKALGVSEYGRVSAEKVGWSPTVPGGETATDGVSSADSASHASST